MVQLSKRPQNMEWSIGPAVGMPCSETWEWIVLEFLPTDVMDQKSLSPFLTKKFCMQPIKAMPNVIKIVTIFGKELSINEFFQ